MFQFFQNKQGNAEAVTNELVKALNVKLHPSTISKGLKDHPDYPSLFSISDFLRNFNLPNSAFRVDKEDIQPNDVQTPFIVQVKDLGSSLLVVHEFNAEKVVFSDGVNRRTKISYPEFDEKWTGVVLEVEKKSNSGDPNYSNVKFKENLGSLTLPFLLLTFFATLLYVVFQSSLPLSSLFSLGIKGIGLATSILLLVNSIDSANQFVQNLCGLIVKTDCNNVLKSDGSKITSWLNWSEVGFIYFCGTFLINLLVPASSNFLSWLSVACLPYTFYSIWFQYKSKNWCTLCCTIQAVLWLEFSSHLALGEFFNSFSVVNSEVFNMMIQIVLCFSLPIGIWAFLKPFFSSATQVTSLKSQLSKFKFDPEIFNFKSQSTPHCPVTDSTMPIVLGNKDAETRITIVSGPFCGPCSSTHKLIDDWLLVRDDLRIEIIFAVSGKPEDISTQVATSMIGLGKNKDQQSLLSALNEWYLDNTKDFEKWLKKFPIQKDPSVENAMEEQKSWCKKSKISVTPTIFVNGYQIPENYSFADLKYILN